MDLFGEETALVPGFTYYPDFISKSEERDLLGVIREVALHSFVFHGYEAKRRVASFGYDYSFDDNKLRPGKEIPGGFQQLVQRVALSLAIDPREIRELLVTEYPVGAQINWHRDAFPFEIIAGVSLLADCTFRFRPYETVKQGRKSIRSCRVRRRSLYIIRDEARLQWQHSIPAVNEKRYSITLRTLRDRAKEVSSH
jgi:alkylated DNA repair dioxygenase AlkB